MLGVVYPDPVAHYARYLGRVLRNVPDFHERPLSRQRRRANARRDAKYRASMQRELVRHRNAAAIARNSPF